MNTVMTIERDRHEHPPRSAETQYRHEARRVGVVDRIALYVGVALVAWSRRPRAVQSHGQRADTLQQQRDRLVRELAAERMYYTMVRSQR